MNDNKLVKLLNDVFGRTAHEIHGDARIMELKEWDSMKHMEFILGLESLYALQFTGEEIASMDTINRIQEVVNQKRKEASLG